jgi:hypothetical protein
MTKTRTIREWRYLLLIALPALAVMANACDSSSPAEPGDPGGDVPTNMRTVTLSPSSDDSAAWLRFVGARVTQVTAVEGEVFFTSHGDTTEVVVVRSVPGPLSFNLRVADPAKTPVGTVVQIADGQNLLRDPTGYLVEVKP